MLSTAIGAALFKVHKWLYSERFKAQKDLIDLQKGQLELYAGRPAGSVAPTAQIASNPIVPEDWSPYLNQAISYLEDELSEWSQGQQGANRNSADLGSLYDAQLFGFYVRLYEGLSRSERDQLKAEFESWLRLRVSNADEAVHSRGGTLAPLEFNSAFIDQTKEKIVELRARIEQASGGQTRLIC